MLVKKLVSYKAYSRFGFPKAFPMNLTLGLSYKCNSRCKTCNIWKKRGFEKELSLEEFEKIFRKIGKNRLYLLILTGGEPFLHNNLAEIVSLAEKYCTPKTIVIPTNCILSSEVIKKTEEILNKSDKKTHITINLSLDGVEGNHDSIRGVKGNFKKFIEVYSHLKDLERIHNNFDVSVHTVISAFNYNQFPEIYESVKKLNPLNFITEIAEEREELGNKQCGITPSYEQYSKAIDLLIKDAEKSRLNLKQSMRLQYYKMVKKIIKEKRQIIPCYAGIASAQIDPAGEVWFCCVRGESIGNLRDADYDLMKLWYNEKAKKQRRSIKNKECYCPLASANYTNLSLDPKSSVRIISDLLKSKLK
jgi:MoaA/NifB/PqqE/SkfB family radical SAM enzyme